jgi:hypothetical protein
MRSPRKIFFLYGTIIIGALSYFIYVTPMNVNDNLANILFFETNDFERIRQLAFAHSSFEWRPGYYLITDPLQMLASGHEHAVYKTLQVLLFAGAGLIFLGFLQVNTWREFAAGAVALPVILGHHSLDGAVGAVYPINPYMIVFFVQTIIIRALLKPISSAFDDILVVLLCITAISVTELGGIVGVTYIVGSLLRLPGASLRVAAAVFILYVLLVFYRFVFITDMGLVEIFGSARGDRLFRIAAPALAFLLSDPRGARFAFVTVAKLLNGELWAAVYLLGSILLTALILAWAMHALRRSHSSASDWKVAALLLVSLLVGSMFGIASDKEYLTIVSLPLYGLAAYRALHWATEAIVEVQTGKQLVTAIAVGALLIAISATWSIRATGLFFHLRAVAFEYQEEWAIDMQRLGRMERYQDEHSRSIADRMRAQALATPLRHPNQVFPKAVGQLLRGRGCPAIC